MSRCSIIVFEDGIGSLEKQYSNSWGGAAYIWNCLYDRYLKRPDRPYDSWLMAFKENDNRLWNMIEEEKYPIFIRAVLASTFDYAIIRNKNFKTYAKHLEEFVKDFPPNGVYCHLADWANFIKDCEYEAIGFHTTSVADNLWLHYDEETDDSIFYNIDSGDKHFEVYERFGSLNEEIKNADS